MNFESLLGAVAGSGMSRSTGRRLGSSLGGGGTLGGALGSVLEQAGRAVGGRQNLAIGGLGALAGALLGGGRRSLGGALGGGVMALLGAMAFQALRERSGQQSGVPLGLAVPRTDSEREQLDRNSGLVLRAMINAAKADGTIDPREISSLVGRIRESGAGSDALEFLQQEMAKPMETEALVEAARGQPELAAELYAASLLAIEVDTPAEKEYLAELASDLGLEPVVTDSLQRSVGLQKG
jgi:uncharacterized membrane protein YebE (DUF533 family)